MTVQQMLSNMSARELEEWKYYYTLEPWGEWVEDLRSGQAAASIVNCWSKKKVTASMYRMDFGSQMPKEQDYEEQKLILKAFASRN